MGELDGDEGRRDMQLMSYTVTVFREVSGERHLCTEPLVIPAADFLGYGATIDAWITSLFGTGEPADSEPTGLKIVDPSGKFVFTYRR